MPLPCSATAHGAFPSAPWPCPSTWSSPSGLTAPPLESVCTSQSRGSNAGSPAAVRTAALSSARSIASFVSIVAALRFRMPYTLAIVVYK